MRIIFLWLVLGFFFTHFLPGDCNFTFKCDPVDPKEDYSWESTQTKIKAAKSESEVLEATYVFRNSCRDDDNEILHDMVQFLCGITLSRMCIDDAYTKEVHPNISVSSIDVKTATQEWRDFLVDNRTDGLAERIRKAYQYLFRWDEAFVGELSSSVPKTADLCRRYETKIPEMRTTYETQLQSGNRLTLADVLQNHTDWSMVFNDVHCVNRIRDAEAMKIKISWAWVDEATKKVWPYCPSK